MGTEERRTNVATTSAGLSTVEFAYQRLNHFVVSAAAKEK